MEQYLSDRNQLHIFDNDNFFDFSPILLCLVSIIFHLLKYLLRDKCQGDRAFYNCAQRYKVGCCFNNPLLLAGGSTFLFTLFSQAGWWFNFCFYVLLTATSVGPNGNYVSSPHLVWRRTINIGQSDNFENVIDSNHAKFSHAKFTLKLK